MVIERHDIKKTGTGCTSVDIDVNANMELMDKF